MNTALQIAFAGGYGKLGADDNVVGKGLLRFLPSFFALPTLHMLCSAAQFINLNAIFHVKIALLKREFVQFTATAEKRRRASVSSLQYVWK